MSLDGLVVHALVHEMQACLGGRINKIYQPSEHDIVMHIRAQGSNFKLLISANPTYPRIHFTEKTFMNPLEAPMFCMLMRKHFEGGIIRAIEQADCERIIRMHVNQRDEVGDLGAKTLIVELTGRHSNIIMADPATGKIIDGIHHVTPAISSYRVVLPGSAYTPPPDQHKTDPLQMEQGKFCDLFQNGAESNNETVAARLVRLFSGISPLIANEIVYRSGLDRALPAGELDGRGLASLWDAFAQVTAQVKMQRYIPAIVTDHAGKSVFSVVELKHAAGTAKTFDSVSRCLEAYYGDKAERDTVKQRTLDLFRLLQNEKNKNVKKLEKLNETILKAQDADKYRIMGELLTSSLHLIRKGDKEAKVVNYYEEGGKTVTIPLDPQLTPSENAQRYFKLYTKTKNGAVAVREQIRRTEEEIVYLDTLLQQLKDASLRDIEEIRQELAEQGYIRHRNLKPRKTNKKEKPVLTVFTSSEGVPIYVGKNNTQNEFLTNRLAHPDDTWLHTKNIPGSHVVIRGGKFGEKTLLEAAQLAAYFSQARESSRVPVDYTFIRHVRKPNGAKPGFVIYDHQKTIFVTPDKETIDRLKT